MFDNILRLSIGLVMTIWLARYLEPNQFGLFSYALAISALLSPLAKLGLDNIVVRDLILTPEKTGQILGTTFSLRILTGIGTGILGISLAILLNPNELSAQALVSILSISTVMRAFETIALWFQSQVQSKYVVYAKIGAFLFSVVIQTVLIFQRASLLAFATVILCEIALSSLGMAWAYRQYGPGFKEWKFSIEQARTLLNQGWPLVFSALAITLYMKVDQLMLAYMVGNESVGIYSAATRISEALYFAPIAVVCSVAPALIEAKGKSIELYHQRLQQLFSLMVVTGVTISIFITSTSSFLIYHLFGSNYIAAAPVLTIHIWASVFVFLGVVQGLWDVNEHLQKLAFARASFGSVMNIVLNLFLIPAYGAMGASIATLISYVAINYFANLVHPKTSHIFYMQSRAFRLSKLIF
jgi:polysaccharide transporter, PST family